MPMWECRRAEMSVKWLGRVKVVQRFTHFTIFGTWNYITLTSYIMLHAPDPFEPFDLAATAATTLASFSASSSLAFSSAASAAAAAAAAAAASWAISVSISF